MTNGFHLNTDGQLAEMVSQRKLVWAQQTSVADRLGMSAVEEGQGPGATCLPSLPWEERGNSEICSQCVFHSAPRLWRCIENSSDGTVFARAKTQLIISNSSRFESIIKTI